MFDLGMGEVILLAVIALIVMGPEKFPEVARIAIRAFRDFRGYIDDLKREVANEVKPVKEGLTQIAKHNPEEYLNNVLGDNKKDSQVSEAERFPYPVAEEESSPSGSVEPRYPAPNVVDSDQP